MAQISSETDEESYEAAIKPYQCRINALAAQIIERLEKGRLNEWAKLATLEKVKKNVEESLGTLVCPGGVDVPLEDQRLEALFEQIRENKEIEKEVSAIINSTGYKLRNYNENQIWEIVAASEHYF
jgi:DNA-binding TFAR19-related protein (PDSD5 family)